MFSYLRLYKRQKKIFFHYKRFYFITNEKKHASYNNITPYKHFTKIRFGHYNTILTIMFGWSVLPLRGLCDFWSMNLPGAIISHTKGSNSQKHTTC